MIILDGHSLTIEQLVTVAREKEKVQLADQAKKEIEKGRSFIEEKVANHEVVYGVTTGFGEFSQVSISPEKLKQLQRNLIVSHAVGVGEPLAAEVVRAIMLLRINALAQGNSGIRLVTVETLIKMLTNNADPQPFDGF